jgi:membrane-bound metal-dependent hydrolase YbcI (DUF457 family)
MFIFGHSGITLGAAVLLSGALAKSRTFTGAKELEEEQQRRQGLSASESGYSGGIVPWISSLASRIDIRLLLIGSLLPDLIDKPIGRVFFVDIFNNGRIFCHTLLFLIVLIAGGFFLYRRSKKTWLLALSFGTFTHLILDMMWLEPRTLLWPLYGLQFESMPYNNWIRGILYAVLNEPLKAVPELIGLIVIIWFVWLLTYRKKLFVFIRSGRV